VSEQRPEQSARDSFDEVLAIQERAAVDREEPHQRCFARVSGRGAGTAHRALVGTVRPGAFVGQIDLDRARDQCCRDGQQRFVLGSECELAFALDCDDADQLTEHHCGHGDLTLGPCQPRQRDHMTGRLADVLLVRPADGSRVRDHPAQVADAHRFAARGCHTDDALTDADFRADAVTAVAVTGNGVQALAVLVE